MYMYKLKRKLKLKLKRFIFNVRVNYALRRNKPYLKVTDKHRQVGKTTKLVKLVQEDPLGILVVGNYRHYHDILYRYKGLSRKKLEVARDIIRYRPHWAKNETYNLYIDEIVYKEEVELLSTNPNYKVKLYLEYIPKEFEDEDYSFLKF